VIAYSIVALQGEAMSTVEKLTYSTMNPEAIKKLKKFKVLCRQRNISMNAFLREKIESELEMLSKEAKK
jgi:hypothetical protein